MGVFGKQLTIRLEMKWERIIGVGVGEGGDGSVNIGREKRRKPNDVDLFKTRGSALWRGIEPRASNGSWGKWRGKTKGIWEGIGRKGGAGLAID